MMTDSPWKVIERAVEKLRAANGVVAFHEGQEKWPKRKEDFVPPQLFEELEWIGRWLWIGEGGVWEEPDERMRP